MLCLAHGWPELDSPEPIGSLFLPGMAPEVRAWSKPCTQKGMFSKTKQIKKKWYLLVSNTLVISRVLKCELYFEVYIHHIPEYLWPWTYFFIINMQILHRKYLPSLAWSFFCRLSLNFGVYFRHQKFWLYVHLLLEYLV